MRRKKINFAAFLMVVINLANIVIVRETCSFIVLECPGSTVRAIRQQVPSNEISAIFYYTNWNSKSLDAYTLYNDVSTFFSDYIFFAAINCGHRMCNCSYVHSPRIHRFSRGLPNEWPTLMVYYENDLLYVNNRLKLQYFGAWKLSSLMQFFNYLLQPIERLYTRQQLQQICLESDKVIVGIFKNGTKNNKQYYRNYVLASIKWLEYDNKRSCRFMAVFDQQYQNIIKDIIDLQQVPALICITPKGIVAEIFGISSSLNNSKTAWNTSNIVEWFQKCIINNDAKSLSKTHMHGYSSPITIARVIKYTPLLVILPHRKAEFLIHMRDYAANTFHTMRIEKYHKNYSICEEFLSSTVNTQQLLDTKFETIEGLLSQCVYKNDFMPMERNYLQCERRFRTLKSIDYLRFYYKINDYLNQLLLSVYNPFTFIDNNVLQSMTSLQQIHLFTNCLKFGYMTESVQLRIIVSHYVESILENIYEKNRIYNQTLSVVIPDENASYLKYLESLHIFEEDFLSTGNDNNKTANNDDDNNPSPLKETLASAVIIDNNNESIYVMSKNFSNKNLHEFLIMYHNGDIQPLQRYIAKNDEDSYRNGNNMMKEEASSIRIEDVNSNEFLNVIHSSNQSITIVLLMYSTSCALCAALQQTFLQVASALRNEHSLVRFMRINIHVNDLPWQFSMPYVPKLIVFPKDHYDDSVILSQRIKPSYGNVLSFILAQMSSLDQIRLLITLCKRQLITEQRNTCWLTTKRLLIQHTNKYMEYLKYYNMVHISFIVEQLISLQQLSLIVLAN